MLPKTSNRVFSGAFPSQRSRAANTHTPVCFLRKLPGAWARLWASKRSENENLLIYFQTNISFSGRRKRGLFVNGQDSISLIAAQFYIFSNKQKLFANLDQRDSKVLLFDCYK